MVNAQDRRNGAMLLMLGMVLALVLFVALRPLQVESPASAGARAMLRLDAALGATVEPVADAKGLTPNDGPLVVTSIANGGPAASAGLQVGDVIEQIDGKPPDGTSTVINAAAPVRIRRGSHETTIEVKFGSGARS